MDAIRKFDDYYEAKKRKLLAKQCKARSTTRSSSSDGSPSKKRKRHQDENQDPRDTIAKSRPPQNGHVNGHGQAHNQEPNPTSNGYHKETSPNRTLYTVESVLHDSHDKDKRVAFLEMLQKVPGVSEWPSHITQ